jgi:hypothetical protein
MLLTPLAVVMAISLGVPASADPPAPQITDAAGDANFINAQGNTNVEPADGPDTSAAYSEAGADIRTVRYSTRYWTVKTYNEDGSLEKIDYQPNAFQMEITTAGPTKPSKFSLIFRIQTTIAGCETWFQAWIKGTQAQATELERADIRKLTATCPGGATTVFAGFQQIFDENVMTLVFPFASASFTGPMAGFIKNGTQLDPLGTFTNNANYPHVRTSIAGSVTAPSIDQTDRPAPFTVGSDVPADVICAQTPDNPECSPSPIP